MHKLYYRFPPCICWIVLCYVLIIMSDNYFQSAFGCLEEEKIGLLKLKDVLNHHNRSVPSTWGDEQVVDCCRWEGITCDEDVFSKRIVNLSLSIPLDNTNEWFMDPKLFEPFEELQNLTIHDSSTMFKGVKGPLKLTKLQVLDLGDNSIAHVPLTGELPSLKFLELYGNNINDDDFQELAKLSNLELLNLDNNGIAGNIPSSILALTSLKMLGLSFNDLNGSFPEGLCTFTNLEELDLSQNEFDGVIPACLSNLTSLRILDLSNNMFSGTIPSNLFSSLNSLEFVSLSQNSFDGLISFGSFAHNSKLKVFDLESNNPNLKVDTEHVQWKSPFFQLEILRLSNCILNEAFGGVIPSFLLSQYELRIIDLSQNGMTGEPPSWLLTNNSKLEYLNLRNNRFSGQLKLQPDAYNVYMEWLDLSMNQVAGEIPSFIGYILPNLTYLSMSTNAIDGSIPTSIGNMKKLNYMDLSNNHLSGELVGNLFNGCERLENLNLSNNNLEGNLTYFLSNILRFPDLWVLYLKNNNFSGDLQLETLHLEGSFLGMLDISNNSITGRFPDCFGELSRLTVLILSKNNFQGKLPTSFCKLTYIQFLDLSLNNFSDTLPPCINLPLLEILRLQGNGFHGPLPTSLSNSSSSIRILDMSNNKFSGLIPSWIKKLSNLQFLILKGNLFHGLIPSEICKMKNLQILDFGANNLSGYVPPCLSQISFGEPESMDIPRPINYVIVRNSEIITTTRLSESYVSRLHVTIITPESYGATNFQEEVGFITKSVYESYKGDIMYQMVGIDLSLNRLTGPIPIHFGSWVEVHSLNLSYNNFNGSIPGTLSSLINLESLDLSHNMLSGKIPLEITKLGFIEVFSVAYNNLSGLTPTTGQFATFDEKSYEGNPLLCGPLLDRSCSPRMTKMPHEKPFAESEQNDSSFKSLFLWSFFGSFIVSCVGAFLFLYFNTNVPQIFLVWIGIEERVPPRRTIEIQFKWKK